MKHTRQIIQIDQDKCDGCGICISACHEGAIGLIDGKAQLLREDYCDGLGDCLPHCPQEAISFVEKEAKAYDEDAVKAHMASMHKEHTGCPSLKFNEPIARTEPSTAHATIQTSTSQLQQWPIQIQLVPVQAPYYENANLLIAADCCAYAYANFHSEYIRNHITIIGCPKLDDVYYAEKLTQIIANNNIRSVKILRMEVPCCGGIEQAAKQALQDSGKFIPWSVETITTHGEILD
ncbi:MAG: ATP-binding protein [Breznakia sp.]